MMSIFEYISQIINEVYHLIMHLQLPHTCINAQTVIILFNASSIQRYITDECFKILYYTMLYYTILYYTILYYTVQHFDDNNDHTMIMIIMTNNDDDHDHDED